MATDSDSSIEEREKQRTSLIGGAI